MGAFQDPPIELPVLDLVLAEGSELGGRGGRRREAEAQQEAKRLAHRRMVLMRSPWEMRLSAPPPLTTRPNTV
jgi:hypothetical protein